MNGSMSGQSMSLPSPDECASPGDPPSEPRPDWWPTDVREGLLEAVLLLGAWTALATETLGYFGALDRRNVTVVWGLFALALPVAQIRRWRGCPRGTQLGEGWRGLPILSLVTVCVFSLLLLIVALVAPPNSIDSIQYHMARVAHWAQQGSLANFATPIERQLYMPPFAEMAVLNLYLLAGGDRLVNLVQWGSMIAALVGVSLIAARLEANAKGQAMALLFAATLPMGILQATSTQNDYVNTLWIICLAYFALKAHRVPLTTREWVLAGIAVGLGNLTKSTFFAFAFPLLAWLGVSTLRHCGWGRALRCALLGLALVGALNARAWARNLGTFDTPVGPRWAISLHANEILSWRVMVSNLVRSATLNLATPYGDANGPMRDLVVAAGSVWT
jgi:hypothetical protein